MENRRPPRSNSSGRKPYFGRGRGAPSLRDRANPGNSISDGDRPQSRVSDGYNRGYRSRGTDGRSQMARPDGRFRKDGRRFDGPGRFNRNDRTRPRLSKSAPPENDIKITSDSQITDGRFRGKTLLNSSSPKAAHTNRKLRAGRGYGTSYTLTCRLVKNTPRSSMH